jgi:hypothetical protein
MKGSRHRRDWHLLLQVAQLVIGVGLLLLAWLTWKAMAG